MNENIDLTKILKDCPKGTKLYSSLYGEVELVEIELGDDYPIIVHVVGGDDDDITYFAADGLYYRGYKNSETVLFPSKSQRDWSKFKCPKPKFDPKTLQPFDRVIVKQIQNNTWHTQYFSHINEKCTTYPFFCLNDNYAYCIPYNDDTKHLLGTTDEAPEYYRYWED